MINNFNQDVLHTNRGFNEEKPTFLDFNFCIIHSFTNRNGISLETSLKKKIRPLTHFITLNGHCQK
ncbi:hypothetical protein DERP_015343 [Dermatophagoides pteronyssinus]|uniref:Uncharacterized protein n=1 Tax=Dermatophagoides pteronyssinus TaxID=6956 RepID=A0ABQ8JX59_DERPT|nr:hypothetical protein DERP_015343 [Dermatophagoides pteronyssinus]